MSVLVVDRLTAGYGKNPIVWDVNLQAKVGQVVGIVGPNGAGKSTLLKAIFSMVRIESGNIRLDETDVTGRSSYLLARSGLAYVPQVQNVFATMSVEENLELGGMMKKSDLKRRISEVLEIFPDLHVARNKKGGDLSGGQRNMLGMARALMAEPKVILLDEPTAGLSPIYVDVVWQQVKRIAESGTSVVVVEQNVDRAISSSDWVYVLVAGRNRVDGPAAAIAELELGEIFLGAVQAANEEEGMLQHK
ncbi:MAG: ABC transporter ATP-binding protein [Acidimicrobiaceae bacterium]|nr:ABC transporter ATP-binding protein [Acidimicrobiaceae bacterium]